MRSSALQRTSQKLGFCPPADVQRYPTKSGESKVMGLGFIDGHKWSEVTREERFFCQHLYHLIGQEGTASFVHFLNASRSLDLPESANWEAAYEACFYRDLWHYRGCKGQVFSLKRTFDLCLLSDEAIVLIEAKAQQDFDLGQLNHLKQDRKQVRKATRIPRVVLLGLASSRCSSTSASGTFDAPVLTWDELARRWSDDPVLSRANEIYEPGKWASYGQNNTDGYMTGTELVAAYDRGERLYVGRKGGLIGRFLQDDLDSERWRIRRYETNRDAQRAPNRNWFPLSEFVRKVKKADL